MRSLYNNILALLLCISTLLSCEKPPMEDTTGLKEVKIAVVLPEKDREPIWNNALEWAAENIRKADIGVKVVYEWVDEESADLTKVGTALSEREDIRSIIGCNVSANTQALAFALARKKQNIKPLFTFSTSQELPRIFGHRGFLWGLCETDISQSEIILSCLSNENPELKKVALLASDDIYGQTFVDWFAFQAVELNLEPVCIETYKKSSELEDCLERIIDSGAEAVVCVPAAAEDAVPVQNYINDFIYNSESWRYIALMFADKAYNESILRGEYPMDFISGLAPASHPGSGFDVSYDALYGRVPYAGEAQVYDAVLITVLASIWAEKNEEEDLNKAIAALLNVNATTQGGWTAGMIANYHRQIQAGETPAISGATGTLDFNSEYYTTIRSTSYAHWITYNGKMFAIIETCYSGVVAQECTGIPGLLLMTAANPYEPSKAATFDDELQVYLSNTFTASILSQFALKPRSTIYDLYLHAFDKTQGSHVMVYNAEHYGNLRWSNIWEF